MINYAANIQTFLQYIDITYFVLNGLILIVSICLKIYAKKRSIFSKGIHKGRPMSQPCYRLVLKIMTLPILSIFLSWVLSLFFIYSASLKLTYMYMPNCIIFIYDCSKTQLPFFLVNNQYAHNHTPNSSYTQNLIIIIKQIEKPKCHITFFSSGRDSRGKKLYLFYTCFVLLRVLRFGHFYLQKYFYTMACMHHAHIVKPVYYPFFVHIANSVLGARHL